ncbi:MAG: glycosyltransferase family 4 protein [Clostridiaceae bacterium]|nr:glycosyltransferase family 4 protein [Clostridiaceae bacterium]
MKKLWIINQYAATPDTAGITRHYELAKRLKKYGWETTIVRGSFDLYLKRGNRRQENRNSVVQQEFDGVTFLTIPTPPYKDNKSAGRIWNMIVFGRRACRILASLNTAKPDIVMGSTMTLFGADAARKIARFFEVPFIYEVRDLWPLTPIEIGGYSKWHPFIMYLDYLDRKLARSADLIVTITRLMKDYYIERMKLSDEKFLWLTNGTDTTLFSEVKSTPKEPSSFKLYYTGSLGLANGIDAVFNQLKAIKLKYPKFKLVLVGDGPYRNLLQSRSETENLPVIFLDPVPKTKLPELLADADALLFYLLPSPLYRYGIGANKLADYHAAGKPILFVGDCAENPVHQSGAGIVAKSIGEFPCALGKLMCLSIQEKEAMGEKGREYARERYDWEKLSDKFNSLISSISAK